MFTYVEALRTYTLTIKVYETDEKVLAERTMTIHVPRTRFRIPEGSLGGFKK